MDFCIPLCSCVKALLYIYLGNFSIIISSELNLLKFYGDLSFLVIFLFTISFSYVNTARSVLLLFTFVLCSVSYILTFNLPLPTEKTWGTDLKTWMSFTSRRELM